MLLDRADELAECDRLLASVGEGRGAVLLVEAGAGGETAAPVAQAVLRAGLKATR